MVRAGQRQQQQVGPGGQSERGNLSSGDGKAPLLAGDVLASREMGIFVPSKVVPQVIDLSLKETSGTGFLFCRFFEREEFHG